MLKNEVVLDMNKICEDYNLNKRTYHYHLKKGLDKYDSSKLKKIKRGVYYVDKTILPEMFSTRRPNKNDKDGIRNYILNNTFQIIGNIHTDRHLVSEIPQLIKEIHKQICNILYPDELNIFWFSEVNPKQNKKYQTDRLGHVHFVIECKDNKDYVSRIKRIITNMVGGKQEVEKYNTSYGDNGLLYTMKDLDKDNTLFSYITYKKRKYE